MPLPQVDRWVWVAFIGAAVLTLYGCGSMPLGTPKLASGNPTEEEVMALQAVLKNHKAVELKPVIKRSVFGLPQLRQPLPHQVTFGARKFD